MSESQTKKYESLEPGIRAFLIEGESLYPENAVEFTMDEQRAFYDRYCAHFRKPRPAAVSAEDFTVGAVPCRRYRKTGTQGVPVMLYLHGGGYVVGGLDSHDDVCAEICDGAGIDVVAVQYRLAPEHPFPAAHDDACAAWEALAAEVPPDRIAIGGDSAGGGLAFALLRQLIARKAPLPAGVVAFSPWTDLTGTAASLRTLAARDALLPAARFHEIGALYLAGADPRDPRASPRFGAYPGAPPVLIQSSRAEILRDDARAMAARLRAEGVLVRHDEWRLTPHVWQIYAGLLPEADQALDVASAFLRQRFDNRGAKPVAETRSPL
jgi:monoterpene epsilon-lactone hydrolase